MRPIHHLTAGARGRTRLVHDDFDRADLLRRVRAALGDRTLAYCLMDTHLHVVAEGPAEDLKAALRGAFRGYARRFNARHDATGPLLRGPVEHFTKTDAVELARAIRYVHDNPLKTREPLASSPVEFVPSSAREHAGLARVGWPNVARTRELAGRHVSWMMPQAPPLAGLELVDRPTASPEYLLAAAAQTHGLLVEEVLSGRRAPAIVAARSAFVVLGRLESYIDRQLAPVLGTTRQRITQIRAGQADLVAVRVARTLVRTAALKARLRPLQICSTSKSAPPSRAMTA